MKVNIEAQCLADRNFRGIPYYTLNLIEELLKLDKYEYNISYFDYNKERQNGKIIRDYLSDYALSKLNIFENNKKNYGEFREKSKSMTSIDLEYYSDLFDGKADVYHFPHTLSLGFEVPKKTVVTIHDLIPLVTKGMGYCPRETEERFIGTHKYIQKRKDIQIIAISKFTKKDLCEKLDINPSRIDVIYDGFDSAMCYPEESKATLSKYGIDSPYLLYIGALEPRKGINDIVEAFAEISSRYKDIKLVLAGKKEDHFIEQLHEIQKSEVVDKIIFTGYVTDDEKRNLYSSAEMFLFPSKYEGFGLPVLEAMACGCPVITSNTTSLPEVGGKAADYVTPGDSNMLAFKISTLLDDKEKREKMSELGILQAKQFTWKSTAIQTESVYKKVINI